MEAVALSVLGNTANNFTMGLTSAIISNNGATFGITAGAITVNVPMDMSDKTVSNIGEPKKSKDAVNLLYLQQALTSVI